MTPEDHSIIHGWLLSHQNIYPRSGWNDVWIHLQLWPAEVQTNFRWYKSCQLWTQEPSFRCWSSNLCRLNNQHHAVRIDEFTSIMHMRTTNRFFSSKNSMLRDPRNSITRLKTGNVRFPIKLSFIFHFPSFLVSDTASYKRTSTKWNGYSSEYTHIASVVGYSTWNF